MTKRILLLSFILLPIASLFAQDINEARDLLNSERYSSAEKVLEKQIERSGTQPDLNYLLVKTYLQQEKSNEAWNFIEKNQINKVSAAVDPINKVAYANYLFNTGKNAEAKEILTQLLEDKKARKNIDLLMAIAEVYVSSGENSINDALQVIEIAEKKDKHNASLDILKGNAYRVLHDGSKAYVAYYSAIKEDPRNVMAHYQLGNIFQSQQNEEMYMEHYLKAYAIDSTFSPVLEALYNHYYFRDVKKAKVYLEKFIRYADYSIENDYAMADMYYLNKDYTNAIKLASEILEKEKGNGHARLYKMIAYSHDEKGDKEKAWQFLNTYFEKEKPDQFVARDYEFKAKLLLTQTGREIEAIESFVKAFDLDTVLERKIEFAVVLAETYGKVENFASQAEWLGKVYELKKDRTNVDLFNWGFANYKAANLEMADSIFAKYTEQYPDNIYGHYWRAQVNAVVDTSLELGLAIPHYKRVVELGEVDKDANKAMLLKAYGYMGGYEANISKDYQASLSWFEKFLELDPDNADANKYATILREWINDPEKNKDKPEDS